MNMDVGPEPKPLPLVLQYKVLLTPQGLACGKKEKEGWTEDDIATCFKSPKSLHLDQINV